MDRLELIIAVSDVYLGKYGTLINRKQRLTAKYGADGQKEIQDEINKGINVNRYIAIAAIADHYGKDAERRKALGDRYDAVQKEINAIYALRGKTVTEAAKDVIADKYDKQTARSLLLTFCGYTPGVVQDEVNRLLEEPSSGKFRIYPVWFFEKDESAYGDCTAIIEYDASGAVLHTVLIDTAMDGTASLVISKLKAQGVKQIDAVIISHAHGDHYGGLTKIAKSIPVSAVYVPDQTGLDKYQKSYGNALRRQAAKAKTGVTMQVGKTYAVGGIKWTVLYQADATKLPEHDGHHMVNNLSPALRFNLGDIIYHTAGDMSNDANRLLIADTSNLRAHIFKLQWHSDRNAILTALMEKIKPKICWGDYHHKEDSARRSTRKVAESVGATVYRSYEDGDIYIDCQYPKIEVSTSKSGKHDTFSV